MPKVFKSEEEKVAASLARLEKQKAYEKIKRYEKKKKAELDKPCAYHRFRENFMREATGSAKYTNKNYLKHIGFCKLKEMYDAMAPCEYCICGKDIRYVFIAEYKNPNNNKHLIFNIGSKCIIECGSDGLKTQMDDMLQEQRIKDYTCKYCNKVCLHEKSGNAHDHYDVEMRKCKECKNKPWCEFCKKNLKVQSYYPKCMECWAVDKCITVS